jgi:MoaA/NifB/PqqE/SkfB family radical SAM enzyme
MGLLSRGLFSFPFGAAPRHYLDLGRQAIAWRFAPHRVRLTDVDLAIASTCNSRCLHCNGWRQPPTRELSLEELREILDDPFFALEHLTLTGGEPTLRRDLLEVTAYVTRRFPGAALRISTNNLHPDSNAIYREMARIYRCNANLQREFVVLLDLEGRAETHNRLRGVDSYDKTIETFLYCQQQGIPFAILATLSEANVEDLPFLVELSRCFSRAKLGFRLAFAAPRFFHNRQAAFPCSSGLLDRVEQIVDRIDRRQVVSLRFLRDMVVYYRSRRRVLCSAGHNYLFVEADGVVRPCFGRSETMGAFAALARDWPSHAPLRQRLRRCAECFTEGSVFASYKADFLARPRPGG